MGIWKDNFGPLLQFKDVNDSNRQALAEYLDDRIKFHIWFTSLLTGTIVFFLTLGIKPGIKSLNEIMSMITIGGGWGTSIGL